MYSINEGVKLRDFQIGAIRTFYRTRKFVLTIARQHGKTWLGRQTLLDFLFKYKHRRNPVALVLTTSVAQSCELYLDHLYDDYLSKLPKNICWKKGSTAGNHVTLYFKRPEGDIAKIIFIGMNSSTRGLTADFLLADEVAQFQKDLLPTVYFPMLDDTGGKAYLTSTIHGADHYWTMMNGYRELQKTQPHIYGEFSRTIQTAGLRKQEEIDLKIKEAKATGTYHLYLQEYELYPYAAAAGEAPFAEKIWNMRQQKRITTIDKNVISSNRHININIDIGKGGNNRIWSWIKPHTGLISIMEHTQDLQSLTDLPRYLKEKYKKVPYINVFLPSDGNMPSIEQGGTYYTNMVDNISRMNLSHQIRVYVIPRTKNKISLMMRGMEFLDECVFDIEGTAVGLNRLSGAKFRKDVKTGEIIFGNLINNGHQHTVDAWNYIPVVLDNNMLPDNSISRSENILTFYNQRKKWNLTY